MRAVTCNIPSWFWSWIQFPFAQVPASMEEGRRHEQVHAKSTKRRCFVNKVGLT